MFGHQIVFWIAPSPAFTHPPLMQFAPGSAVRLNGLLGEAVDSSLTGHLLRFVRDESSPPIALFRADRVRQNHEGDWYGEHAGKWLVAAARAVERTGEAELTGNLRRVAGFLVARQDADGYLGTYAPERRFMRPQPPGPLTWDGAPGQRTWDIWVHSYLILGLLAAGRALGAPELTAAAVRIGDLCARTLGDGVRITALGNHHGLSATVLLDPAVELYLVTGEKRFLALAEEILRQASESTALELLPRLLAGTDPAFIATGKAYQLCWNLLGVAKLHRATGRPELLDAVRHAWDAIRRNHLTRGGGPWGGVAHRSREVFNAPGVFSPYGYVETCSTFSWIQLNRELLAITGEAAFADEIEKSAYNDLLGAQAPSGDNWCYYSFPNGRRVFTTYWRCCKSSGPWGLEELPTLAYGRGPGNAVFVNLYGPGTGTVESAAAGSVKIEQATDYPLSGEIRVIVRPQRPATFPLHLRIPSWAESFGVAINGAAVPGRGAPNTYLRLEREWRDGDVLLLRFDMPPTLHRATNRNVQESRAPDGSPVAQEVLRFDYLAITRGPLVYATELIDGFKIEETIRLPKEPDASMLEVVAAGNPSQPPLVNLNLGYRDPITFAPYFLAGGRADQTWRLTWLQVV
jgi:uncharacterized protein